MTVPVQYNSMHNELPKARFLGKFVVQMNGVGITCEMSKLLYIVNRNYPPELCLVTNFVEF